MNIVLKSDSGKSIVFWTNADLTMLNHTIRTCHNRYDMIMKWDRDTITHELQWVTYHLIRFGYIVKQKKPNMQTHIYPNVKEMEIRW